MLGVTWSNSYVWTIAPATEHKGMWNMSLIVWFLGVTSSCRTYTYIVWLHMLLKDMGKRGKLHIHTHAHNHYIAYVIIWFYTIMIPYDLYIYIYAIYHMIMCV